jgi:hypothetical protein
MEGGGGGEGRWDVKGKAQEGTASRRGDDHRREAQAGRGARRAAPGGPGRAQ